MAKKQREKAPAQRGKPGHSLDETRRDGGGKGAKKADAGMRSSATVRRLHMYKTRPVRDAGGKVLHNDLQSKVLPSTRIQPDRRWFGEMPSNLACGIHEIIF